MIGPFLPYFLHELTIPANILSNPTTVKQNLKRWANNQRPFAFLQDGTSGKSPNVTQSQKVLEDYLQKMFPKPSQFERSS